MGLGDFEGEEKNIDIIFNRDMLMNESEMKPQSFKRHYRNILVVIMQQYCQVKHRPQKSLEVVLNVCQYMTVVSAKV